MRRVQDVIDEFDSEDGVERKKIEIVKWLQKHPGRRFDVMEIYYELGEELDVGQERISQYLRDLENESILESHGEQRKAYWLANDILIPIKYQISSGLRHLLSVFDIERWGIAGFLVITTTLWAFLTLPFWFLSILSFVTGSETIGPMKQSAISEMTIGMTLWLVVFIFLSYILYRIRPYFRHLMK